MPKKATCIFLPYISLHATEITGAGTGGMSRDSKRQFIVFNTIMCRFFPFKTKPRFASIHKDSSLTDTFMLLLATREKTQEHHLLQSNR